MKVHQTFRIDQQKVEQIETLRKLVLMPNGKKQKKGQWIEQACIEKIERDKEKLHNPLMNKTKVTQPENQQKVTQPTRKPIESPEDLSFAEKVDIARKAIESRQKPPIITRFGSKRA